MDGTTLLTGATGLLGRYLLRDLLLNGHRVALLVRPSSRQSAEERVAGLLRNWTRQGVDLPMPHVLTGDITQEGLGLAAEDRRWADQHCDLVLHNAASLTFVASGGRDGEPWKSNLDGTRNVLEFCRSAEIPDFHHVSTAYVCGLRTGRVLESEGDVGQEFGNDYERSKIEAEQLVAASDFLAPRTIYRPAIIVGDSRTGFTTTFHGFYAILRLAETLVRSLQSREITDYSLPLHGLNGGEAKNFVPVDWVSEMITSIIGRREAWGKTYHLTAAEPVRLEDVRDAILESVGQYSASFQSESASSAAPSFGELFGEETEEAFYAQMKIYETYFRNDPEFDQSHLIAAVGQEASVAPLDRGKLVMLAKVAISMGFRHKDPIAGRVVATT